MLITSLNNQCLEIWKKTSVLLREFRLSVTVITTSGLVLICCGNGAPTKTRLGQEALLARAIHDKTARFDMAFLEVAQSALTLPREYRHTLFSPYRRDL